MIGWTVASVLLVVIYFMGKALRKRALDVSYWRRERDRQRKLLAEAQSKVDFLLNRVRPQEVRDYLSHSLAEVLAYKTREDAAREKLGAAGRDRDALVAHFATLREEAALLSRLRTSAEKELEATRQMAKDLGFDVPDTTADTLSPAPAPCAQDDRGSAAAPAAATP